MPPKFHPRPPSPLHHEPLSLSSEEVLCPGSDEEESSEQHRDKRRRVEALGKQYLQGRGLTILSAGLRGPFEYGWENPWARKWPRRSTNNLRRIPEDPKRAADNTREQRPNEMEVSVPVFEIDRDKVVRARSAPLAFYTGVQVKSTEQDLAQERIERNADQEEPAQVEDVRPSTPKDWLKTILKGRFRETSESPSPTPTPTPGLRSGNRTPSEPSLPFKNQPTNTHSPTGPEVVERPVQNATSISGFTPVNKRRSPQTLRSPIAKVNNAPPNLHNVCTNKNGPTQAFNGVVHEKTLTEANETTLKGCKEAKQLSQEAVKRAKADDDAHLEARKLSQDGALRGYRTSTQSSPTAPQPNITEGPPRKLRKDLAGSPHKVPPSSNLPGFEYRLAKKASSSSSRESSSFSDQLEAAKADAKANRPSSLTRATSRFAEEMEAAKAKAKAQAIKRLSFTGPGSFKSQAFRRSSHVRPSSPTMRQQGSSLRHTRSSHAGLSSEEDTYASATSKLPSDNEGASKSEALPEAQVVTANPDASKISSEPSTDLLKTDKQSLKFPSIDEGDSYMNLSTQAAIARAQRSFQNDVLTPLKVSPQKHRSSLEVSPTAYRTPKAALALSLTTGECVEGQGIMVNDDEAISTQAMIDAMSPFAVTTVKKKPTLVKRASFARSAVTSPASPTANHFRPYSPSMSTSVSPSPSPIRRSSPPPPSVPISLSKAASSLTSFSIAPNGTLTEVYQHDGQQQHLVDQDGWNLEDALEEAGSFLGTWEVEVEARKVGSAGKGASSGASGAKGILSSGKSGD